MEGQLTVIQPYQTPSYRCLYPKPSVQESCRSCSNAGVLGAVPGMIGILQATEAIKLILQIAATDNNNNGTLELISNRQLIYDTSQGDFHIYMYRLGD